MVQRTRAGIWWPENGVCLPWLRKAAGEWTVEPAALRSQGKHTPFSGHQMPARVRWTIVGGQLAYEAPEVPEASR